MTTMTHADLTHATAAATRLHFATRAAVAIALWAAAAVVVVTTHRMFAPVSASADVVAKTLVIFVAGFAYARLASPRTTVNQALIVGASWLFLGVIAEVIVSSATHHPWFQILGSPAKPILRDVVLFAWVAAPAFFARYDN